MAEKYDFEIDLNADTSQTRTMRLVGRGKKVLEFGCATGYVSRILSRAFDCTVTGIEQNPEAAEEARRACHRVIVADAESVDYAKEFQGEKFDVILFADVLEHFKDPRTVLSRVREFLPPEGYVVASIPNIAHAAVALDLLRGNFDYRPWGLLDDTHLRFFNKRSIYELFEAAGYIVSELDRLKADPSATEFGINPAAFPPEVVKFAMQQEESTTYQFIVKAYPSTEAGTIQALRCQLDRAEQLGRGGEAVAAKDAELAAAREVHDRVLADIEADRRIHDAKDAELGEACRVQDDLRAQLEVAQGRAAFLEQERAALQHCLSMTETRTGWAKLGVRIYLGPRGYETAKRLYQRACGLRTTGERTGSGGGGNELPPISGRSLEDFLACPGCGHAPLARRTSEFECPACRVSFPVVRGTPVFLVRAEDYVDRTSQEGRTNPYSPASLDIIHRYPQGVVLDLGAGHPKDEEVFPNVLRQEIHHYPSTHVVSNTPRLPFRDACFDAVVCESVLEHVLDPWSMAEEIHRVLKPGGIVRVDSAFLQPFHGDPSHYFNMTLPGIERVFRRFRKLRSGVDAHQTASYAVRILLKQCHEFVRDPDIRARIEAVLAAPLERVDRELTQEQQQVVGAGVFFEGVKDPSAT